MSDSFSTVERKHWQTKKYLTWEYIDNFLKQLIKGRYLSRYNSVYGIPRGGISIATRLSYLLDIELILNEEDIKDDTLIVDDVADTGITFKNILKNKNNDTLAIVKKRSSDFTPNHYKIEEPDTIWIVFPWEE